MNQYAQQCTAAVGQGPHILSRLLESCSASNRLSTEPRLRLGATFYVAEEAGPYLARDASTPTRSRTRPSIVPHRVRRRLLRLFTAAGGEVRPGKSQESRSEV